MEFLVRFTWTVPATLPDAQWAEIRKAERMRGGELMATGVMKRLWRLPGKRGALGLFEVADATELDLVLTGFPMHPYTEVEVEALGAHPLEASRRSDVSGG
jgi:muconolactone D-isomerase